LRERPAVDRSGFIMSPGIVIRVRPRRVGALILHLRRRARLAG
jgi:hypothetical protein